MSNGVEGLLAEIEKADGPWTQIDGDDFEEQELEDGKRFHACVEVRQTEPAGWSSRYFAVLDTEGDWDDPYEGNDDEDEKEEG